MSVYSVRTNVGEERRKLSMQTCNKWFRIMRLCVQNGDMQTAAFPTLWSRI